MRHKGGIKSPEERYQWAAGRCQALPVRLTPVRERILAFLAHRRLPVKLETVAKSPELGGKWNATTIYRSLMLFVDTQVVRQLRLHSKFSHFILNLPSEGWLYLVCTRCGTLTGGPLIDKARKLVRDLTEAYGFDAVEQELALFGLCPDCHEAALREGPTLKLSSR